MPKASRAPTASQATVRTVAQGEVVGFVAANGAHAWRGLPYAASTAGANRWRAPRAPASWPGRRLAVEVAERCVQLTTWADEDEGLPPGRVVGSEDCLTLDVYAPAGAEQGSLPVMVWIHGGWNMCGRSGAYDGSRLAANEDVVVVAVQYRLGPLGWFSCEAIRAAAEQPEDAAASFAVLDLVAALRWVRDNIASFGGDPGLVTVFGESSGGHNTVALLASPLARGLLHRAIVQSGSFDSMTVAEAEGREGAQANSSDEIAARLGATTAEALRRVPAADLLAACRVERGEFLDAPRMIEDGVALPAGPLREAFASRDTFHAVPIVTGTTRDEMKFFYLRDRRLTRTVLGRLVVTRDQELYDGLTGYLSRLWRIRSVDEPAALMRRAGHEAVYGYRFDWDDGGRVLVTDLRKLLGAAHGLDVPFVFNRFQQYGDADPVMFRRRTRHERERLSRAMGRYWASFARDGVPSCPGEPEWPVYGTGGGTLLRLDAVGPAATATATTATATGAPPRVRATAAASASSTARSGSTSSPTTCGATPASPRSSGVSSSPRLVAGSSHAPSTTSSRLPSAAADVGGTGPPRPAGRLPSAVWPADRVAPPIAWPLRSPRLAGRVAPPGRAREPGAPRSECPDMSATMDPSARRQAGLEA